MSSSQVSTRELARILKPRINEIVGRHVKKDDAVRLINAITAGIAHELQSAKRVSIRGFGSFFIVARKGYEKKASASGFLRQHTKIPDRVLVKFGPSSRLTGELQKLSKVLFGKE